MADEPSSSRHERDKSSSSPNKTKVVRSQKILAMQTSPIEDSRPELPIRPQSSAAHTHGADDYHSNSAHERPPTIPCSHTPGHLATKSSPSQRDRDRDRERDRDHERRRKGSEPSIRMHSHSHSASNGGTVAPVGPGATVPPLTTSRTPTSATAPRLPVPQRREHVNGDGTTTGTDGRSPTTGTMPSTTLAPAATVTEEPRPMSGGTGSSGRDESTADLAASTTAVTGAGSGRTRPAALRSTSAIASRPAQSSSGATVGSAAAASQHNAPSSASQQQSRTASSSTGAGGAGSSSKGKESGSLPPLRTQPTAFPPLQDPETAPDVPAAPSSGMYWSRAPVSGAGHTALRAHTTTLIGSNIYIFGGCDSRACFNELYVLDADSWHWSCPHVVGDIPVPLRAMTCTAVGKKLVIFGGGDGPAYYNDVYVLDTVNFRWSKPRISGMGDRDAQRERERRAAADAGATDGSSGRDRERERERIPSKRRAHTACLYKNGIYIFGGGDGVRALNDIWRLDVSDPHKMSWKLISGPSNGGSQKSSSAPNSATDLTRPKARGYHTANMVGSKLIIYGGSDGGECFNDVWVYDVEHPNVWRAVHIPVTFRRLSHTATIVGSYLFVIGGHDGNEYSNDVLLLNLVTMTWDRRRVYGLPPSGRGYHGTVLHDSRLIVIGGFDGSEVFGDVWILELAVHAYYSQISHFTIDV